MKLLNCGHGNEIYRNESPEILTISWLKESKIKEITIFICFNTRISSFM